MATADLECDISTIGTCTRYNSQKLASITVYILHGSQRGFSTITKEWEFSDSDDDVIYRACVSLCMRTI